MTRATIIFFTMILVLTASVSHQVHAGGINFPTLEFPDKGTFPIRKPSTDTDLEGAK